MTGEGKREEKDKDQEEKELSVSSKAFKMFLGGKSPVDVAIGLNLPKSQTLQYQLDYLELKNRGDLASILETHRSNIPAFLTWFNCLDTNKLKVKDITLAIRYVVNRNHWLKQKENLEKEIQSLIDERDYLLENNQDIKESRNGETYR